MGVGIFWIGLNPTDLGCCRFTLKPLTKKINSVARDKLSHGEKLFLISVDKITLHNVCAVHQGMFNTLGDIIEYTGGYH